MLVRLRNHCAYMAALRTAFKVHSLCTVFVHKGKEDMFSKLFAPKM